MSSTISLFISFLPLFFLDKYNLVWHNQRSVKFCVTHQYLITPMQTFKKFIQIITIVDIIILQCHSVSTSFKDYLTDHHCRPRIKHVCREKELQAFLLTSVGQVNWKGHGVVWPVSQIFVALITDYWTGQRLNTTRIIVVNFYCQEC